MPEYPHYKSDPVRETRHIPAVRKNGMGQVEVHVHASHTKQGPTSHQIRQQWGLQPGAHTLEAHPQAEASTRSRLPMPGLTQTPTHHPEYIPSTTVSSHKVAAEGTVAQSGSLSSTSAVAPLQGTPDQPETQHHCFVDAAGNQICRVISNYHHNATDVHNEHGINDSHNEYNHSHKDGFKGMAHGVNVTAGFPEPGQDEQHASGTHDEGKTVFEGHKSESNDGFRDIHEDNNNGEFQDYKYDHQHDAVDYKEASKGSDNSKGLTSVTGVHDTEESNDVQAHIDSTDTTQQGHEDWDFQLENFKTHGHGSPAEGKTADHPMNAGSPPTSEDMLPKEPTSSEHDSEIEKHTSGHSDDVFDEHRGTSDSYDLHRESNEKDSTSIYVTGSDAFQNLNDTLENMEDIFDDPALEVEGPSAGDYKPTSSLSSRSPMAGETDVQQLSVPGQRGIRSRMTPHPGGSNAAEGFLPIDKAICWIVGIVICFKLVALVLLLSKWRREDQALRRPLASNNEPLPEECDIYSDEVKELSEGAV